MSIPNFSKMSNKALMTFWSRYNRPSRQDARELVGNSLPGYTKVAMILASYACNLAVHRQCKERGDKDGTSVYLHSMRLCLQRLPPEVREAVNAQRVAV